MVLPVETVPRWPSSVVVVVNSVTLVNNIVPSMYTAEVTFAGMWAGSTPKRPCRLIFGTVAYIKETGDFSILDEMVPSRHCIR